MKSQNLFRAIHVMVLLVSFISTNQPAHASASSFDKLDKQIINRNFPEFQNIMEVQPTISVGITPTIISLGEMATVTVNLNNVPVEGYASIEVTCTYYPDLVEARDIVVTDLFGADPVVAVQGPQSDHFVVAIAGSHNRKATNSGAILTFHVRGLQLGLFPITCQARASTGDQVLTSLESMSNDLLVLSPTSTPKTDRCDSAEFVADVTLPPGTVVLPGQLVGKIWRVKNTGSCPWTPSYGWLLFSGALLNASTYNTFAYSIMPGQEADIYTSFMAPTVPGHYQSLWKLHDASGIFFGVGDSGSDPLLLDIVVSGPTVTPAFDLTPSPSPVPTSTVPGDWLIFTNLKYAFQFLYPPNGQLQANHTDTYTRINLPIQLGTNLDEKYLEVIVNENASPCQSPLATQSILETTTTIIMNGIPFVRQTGGDSSAGSIYQWEAYSTALNNVCISLDFTLHSHNPGVYVTPPPSFDFLVETAVFGQIVSTYVWLPTVTATPTIAAVPSETPTPAATATFTSSPTPIPGQTGMLTGQVISAKPATISVYDANHVLVVSVPVALDGRSFAVTLLGGTYTVVASAPGFLTAQGSFTVTSNQNSTLSTISLLVGDIDGNNVIDPMDALTIGMNYNGSTPSAADLNNDGIINVLDLELLARNYRKTGPVLWQ